LRRREAESKAAREQRKREAGYPATWWATDASARLPDGSVVGKCLRQLWYRERGFPRKEYSDAAIWKFRKADAVHAAYEELIAEQARLEGYGALTERYLFRAVPRLERPVGGKPDVLVYRLRELDTVDAQGFSARVRDGRAVGADEKTVYGRGGMFKQDAGPGPDKLLQAAVYIWLADLEYLDLTLDNHDTGLIVPYRVTVNGAVRCNGVESGVTMDSIWERWWYLEGYLHPARPELPPRDYTLPSDGKARSGDWQCRYCDFVDYCRDNAATVPQEEKTT
jgi:hypothetical protein